MSECPTHSNNNKSKQTSKKRSHSILRMNLYTKLLISLIDFFVYSINIHRVPNVPVLSRCQEYCSKQKTPNSTLLLLYSSERTDNEEING